MTYLHSIGFKWKRHRGVLWHSLTLFSQVQWGQPFAGNLKSNIYNFLILFFFFLKKPVHNGHAAETSKDGCNSNRATELSQSSGCTCACGLLWQPIAYLSGKKKCVEAQATVKVTGDFWGKKNYGCSPTPFSGNLSVICGREGLDQSWLGDSGISPFQNCAGFPAFSYSLEMKTKTFQMEGCGIVLKHLFLS